MYGQNFSYWRAREVNSECTGKFHQSPETKKKKSLEVRDLSRLALKKYLQKNYLNYECRIQTKLFQLKHFEWNWVQH